MTLRLKTILVVVLTACVIAAVLVLASRAVLENSFTQLEQRFAEKSILQATARIDDVRTRLLSFCKDWANWDDSYQYLLDHNKAYIEKNLAPEAITNIQINFIVYYDAAGKKVFCRSIDLASSEEIAFSPKIDSAIVAAGINTSKDLPISGIISWDSLLAMVAACPVLKSDFTGPAAGVLIAGRFIDSTIEQQVSIATNLPVDLHTFNEIKGRTQEIGTCIRISSTRDTLVVGSMLLDITKKAALGITLHIYREIYKHGGFAVRNTLIILLLVSVVFVMLIVLILERNVLRILQSLSKRLRELTKRADPSLRLPQLGNDEFGKLTHDINGLLVSLQQSNSQLVASKEEYRELFNEMLTGFVVYECVCDSAGIPIDLIVQEVNPAGEKITGFAKEKIVGNRIRDLMPALEPLWYERIGRVGITRVSDRFEGFMAPLQKHLEIQAFSPAPGIVAVTFSDITDRKNAEFEKEKMQVQLLHSQKMEAIGTMAGGIAHDFNNLLCAIQGYAAMLIQEDGLSAIMHKGLATIIEASNKGGRLVKQLLAFGRKSATQTEILSLNELVHQIINLLERTIPGNIKLILNLPPDLDPIKADPGQVEQILINLALNSRDAMPDGGVITFETSNCILDDAFVSAHTGTRVGSHVKLTVTDTGTGMPPDRLKHIFEPFFTTKDIGKGTGLGLATVFGIVKNHRGYIECFSEVDKGTTFVCYLPSMPGENAAAKDVPATSLSDKDI